MTVTPLTPEEAERLLAADCFIVLCWPPGANAPRGYVEHSFSMGFDTDRTLVCFEHPWLRPPREQAEELAGEVRRTNPDWRVEVHGWRDPDLPVVLDLDGYVDAQASDDSRLSGVRNKFKARNVAFQPREESN